MMAMKDGKEDGRPVGPGFAGQLWKAAEAIAFESLHCPFIIGLGDGSLPRLAFQHYVGQGAIYLQTYLRMYALALAKCDPEIMGSDTFQTLVGLLRDMHRDLRAHSDYVKAWGVDMCSVTATPATAAYSDFLLSVAGDDGASLAHVLVAMTPCARLYAWLGCSLAAAHPGASHAYAAWIHEYSSPRFLAVTTATEALMEHAASVSDAPAEELHRLYARAMELEVVYFTSHPHLAPQRTLRLLVVDFDETCTQRDTSGKLLSLAAAARLQAVEPGPEREQLRLCQEQQLAAAVKNYVDKQAQLLARLLPPEPAAAGLAASGASTAAADMLDVAGLLAFLDQLSDFDVAMNGVVQDAGLLAGLRVPQDLLDAAQPGSEGTGGAEQQGTPGASPALQPGCAAVLQRAQAGGVPVHVLSVCWSADWVQAVLPASCGPLTIPTSAHSTDELVAALPSYLAQTSGTAGGMVLANSLHLAPAPHAAASSAAAGQGLSSGQLVARVQCARDKGRVFAALLAACGTQLRAADESRRAIAQHLRGHAQLAASPSCVPHEAATPSPSSGDQQSGLVVYVGDATSDLLPLLLADVGIVVGQNKLLRRVARTYGIRLQPLVTAPSSSAAPPGVLYEASSWAELDAFACGPRSYEQEPYKAQMQTVRSTWAQSASSSQADAPPSVMASRNSAPGLDSNSSGPQQPFNHSWAIALPQPAGVLLAGTPPTAAADMERWPAARVHDAMRLYAVTDPRLNVREGRDMRSAVAAAVAGGATVVQIRDKDHDGGEFLESARQALEVCRAAGVPLVINDRVDIALALGPDVGVHVGQSDLPCDTVRRLLGPGRLLGVSCKTPEEAQRAVAQGADYVGCGAVYDTTTKDSSSIGVEGVAKVCRSVPGTPVVAIGGIGLTHIKDVMTSGASGVAVVTAIFGQPDVEHATRALRAAVDACLAEQKA